MVERAKPGHKFGTVDRLRIGRIEKRRNAVRITTPQTFSSGKPPRKPLSLCPLFLRNYRSLKGIADPQSYTLGALQQLSPSLGPSSLRHDRVCGSVAACPMVPPSGVFRRPCGDMRRQESKELSCRMRHSVESFSPRKMPARHKIPNLSQHSSPAASRSYLA